MSIYTDSEVCYYHEIPVGAYMISPMARKWSGEYSVGASVKNPVGYPEPMAIRVEQIPAGEWAYVGEPASFDTRFGDIPFHKARWTPDRMAEVHREIDRIGEQETARGCVATLLTPNGVRYPAQDFPADCYVMLGRKPRSVREWGSWVVYRRWVDQYGDRQWTEVAQDTVYSGQMVYVRADYLAYDEDPAGREAYDGHLFMPVLWNAANYTALMEDMRARTELQTRDKVKVGVDKAAYRANQVSLAVAVAIPAIDSDKRTAGRGAWAAFVAWALHASGKQVASNEADRIARMR
jgi:hypothetical protein